jgi:osmoprotectant transport system substrate-binding protein
MRDAKSKITRPIALAAAALLAVTAAGCGGDDEGGGGEGGGTITVGSKEFTEQKVLGQIAIKALEKAGYDVKDQTGIQGTANVRKALTSKQIDLYWEYTGTGWVNNLKHTSADAPKDPKELYQKVADEDLQKNNIKWLDQAPANNSYAIATKAETAQQLGVSTISDYAALVKKSPDDASLCAASEFLTREDGWLGLQKAYGFNLPKDKLSEVELGIIHDSVSKGSPCKFGEVFATDGKIAANNLTVLKDDKQFIVKYNIALNVRKDVFDANPKLADIFNPIAAKLTDEELQKLNKRVDVDEELEEEVAESWLKDNGFLD